jgi:hypothetical protein
MDVRITGTALNRATDVTAPFSMQFDIAGGNLITVGHCGSALMNAPVTDFTADIGHDPFQAPSAFAANVTWSEYPCGSAVSYGELIGAYPLLTLESQGGLLVNHAQLFDGNLGAWVIEGGSVSVASACEPGCALLLAAGVAAVLASCSRPVLRVLALALSPRVAMYAAR